MAKITGRKVEAEPDEIIIEKDGGNYAFPRQISALTTKTQINSNEYALLQEGDEANCAISMKQRNFSPNGRNHLDSNIEILESGLVVPMASRLVTQIINVNKALNEKGILYDASGRLIEGQRLKDYAQTINHNCWVWLNESFEEGEGFSDLNVVYIIGLKDGNPVYQRQPLQKCLREDCYADLLSINEQGFPTEKSPVKKYEPGKSAYFSYPRPDRAVRFGADPGDAVFYCNGDPQGSSAGLGVFECAEGAHAEKSKG